MLTESLLAQLSELEIVIGLNKKCDPSVAYGANKCSPSFKRYLCSYLLCAM